MNHKTSASYQIIDHLFDEYKDFIILGLCGRVGSGVSTVASILGKEFEDLQLPPPGFESPDTYDTHEYRILYNYAQKNWRSFYKIRTSSLITRHILKENVDNFIVFLETLCQFSETTLDFAEIKKHTKSFFEEKMSCCLKDHLSAIDTSSSPADYGSPWLLFSKDEPIEILKKQAQRNAQATPRKFKLNIEDKSFTLEYSKENGGTVFFANCDLSQLLDIYENLRYKKSGFKNPILYSVLKQYLYVFLPGAADKLWKLIRDISPSLPTHALQCIGNNLRLNKTPYFTSTTSEVKNATKDGYTCIAEDINLAIKVLRAYQLTVRREKDIKIYDPDQKQTQKIFKRRTLVVIDSIKNPYESLYLKARYSNYYLIGVYTEDSERHKRLRERKHFVDNDIRAMDIIEQNTEFKDEIKLFQEAIDQKRENAYKVSIIKAVYYQFRDKGLDPILSFISPFILQNVSSCLDSADILINNITDDTAYTYLKRTLLRYICLIMNPGLVLPTNIERCMQIAYTAKLNSGCISRQVGAVLTDSQYHLLSIGWNQPPEGQIPYSYRDLCELHHHWDKSAYSDFENDDNNSFQKKIEKQVKVFFDTSKSPLLEKGKLPHYCFKDYHNSIKNDKNQVHTRALHAEETAFLSLGSHSARIHGGILFTTSSPCELCAKKAMYLGVSKIYYVEVYTGVSQKHVLNIGAMNKRPDLILFTGAIGTAYTKLFTPLLPQKDENEMWLGKKMDAKLVIEEDLANP